MTNNKLWILLLILIIIAVSWDFSKNFLQIGGGNFPDIQKQILDHTWVLSEESLEEIVPGSSLLDQESPEKGPTVTLSILRNEEKSPEFRVVGRSGCNRYFGGMDSDGTIQKNFGSTRMMCYPPKRMELESAYLKALGEVTTIRIVNNQLILQYKDDLGMDKELKFNQQLV